MKSFPRTTKLISKLLFQVGLLCLCAIACPAQTPVASATNTSYQSDYAIVQRGPHSRVWQRTTVTTNQAGLVRTNTHSYTELCTGICYLQNGAYADSVEQINIVGLVGQALQGPCKVTWQPDASTAGGAVQLTSPNGQQFSTRVYGLALKDVSTGSNVLIGQITNSTGVMTASNQIVYPSAFSGLQADIQTTYKLSGFEQDVILRQQLPSPQTYGLNPDTTWFEVLTEFFNPPVPTKTTSVSNGLSDDVVLDFGDVSIGRGTVFQTPGQSGRARPKVSKHWEQTDDGRTFLIEEVPYEGITNLLQALPPHASTSKPGEKVRRTASLKSLLRGPAKIPTTSSHIKVAEAVARRPGVVIDYAMLTTSLTNYIFQSDTTYYVSGTVNLYGSPIFEGGTVIKYTNLPAACLQLLDYYSNFVFKTFPYRPAIFTSANDNSVGDAINGGTNALSVGSATYLAALNSTNSNVLIEHARFSYATNAFYSGNDISHIFRHCQFINCTTNIALWWDTAVTMENILSANCQMMLAGWEIRVNAEHMTVDACSTFAVTQYAAYGNSYSGGLTNCVLTAVDNSIDYFTLANNAVVSSGTGVYTNVGGGNYYLANSSTNLNAGTTNIDPVLLADFQYATTHPPTMISNVLIAANTNLVPQVTRDTNWVMPGNGLDRGYHYDAVDYEVVNSVVSNGVLTLLPGTVIATLPTNGIYVEWSGGLACQGTASLPNWIVAYNVVQEESLLGYNYTIEAIEYGTNILNFGFMNCSVPAGTVVIASEGGTSNPCIAEFQNCQLFGGYLEWWNASLAFTNCLFHRVSVTLGGSAQLEFYNNLCFGGGFALMTDSTGSWTFTDNLFDRTVLWNLTGMTVACSNNAYVTTNYGVLAPEIILSNSPAYEAGALGDYYYPTNLTNLIYAGSQSAVAAGLNYYTVTANNTFDGTNMVSIGFHYVATDLDGVPLNTDGNGLPDYPQDLNVADTLNPFAIYNQGADIFGWIPPNVRLGYWNFGSTNVAIAAMTSNNVFLTNAWSGQAFVITNNSSTNYSQLVYPANTNGSNFFNPGNGTIRFWFQPNWNTTNSSEPTSAFTFLSTQESSSSGDDYWTFAMQNAVDGTGVSLITVGSSTNSREYSQQYSFKSGAYNGVPVTFQSNLWYQMVLTYSPTNMALYTNGVLLATAGWPQCSNDVYMCNVGLGNVFYPPTSGLNNGFSIGSHQYGNYPIIGQMADLETFNYPLTAQEVAAGFPTFAGANYDGITNVMQDTVYDGRSDLLKLLVDGNPTNAANAASNRLGYWRFDSPLLYAEQGQIPLSVEDVALAPSWSGTALVINSAANSHLTYPDVGSNGWANINCREGTLRFWFKPNSGGAAANTPFVYVGAPDLSDQWGLWLGDASTVGFITGSNGVSTTHFWVSCNLSSSNWTQFVLTYGTNSVALYTNGVLAYSNTPSTNYWPRLAYRQLGMVIGNNTAYSASINGQFEEMETFNYQLPASEISSNFQIVASVDTDLDGIPDLLEDIHLSTNRPFLGTPVVITGTIEAEQFDMGGPGVGYSNAASNPTSSYRPTGMLISPCTNELGGGYCLDQTQAGDWAKYSINVLVSQPYMVEVRAESVGPNTGGVFQCDFTNAGVMTFTNSNGAVISNSTGPLTITTTNWTIFTNVVYLTTNMTAMTLHCLTNDAGGKVGRFNYISIYPYWPPPTVGSASSNVNLTAGTDYITASNNAVAIQNAVNYVGSNGGGTVSITNPGTYYVAQAFPNETNDAYQNAAVYILTNNIEIAGTGETNTTLIAYNRATTFFCFGNSPLGLAQCANFTLRDMTIQAQPLLAVTNTNETTYVPGGLAQGGAAWSVGSPTVFYGQDSTHCAANILITNCQFLYGFNPILIPGPTGNNACVSNVMIRGCDFILWGGTNTNYGNVAVFAFVSNNLIVMDCTCNGNVNLAPDANNPLGPFSADNSFYSAPGFVYLPQGGNFFIARNTIINYYFEAIQLNAGPNAVVGNTYSNLINDPSCCALNAWAYNSALLGTNPVSYSTCFIGNAVYGGRDGELGGSVGFVPHPYSLTFSGNVLQLYPPYSAPGEYPGAAVSIPGCLSANVCGNTLLSGGCGVHFISANVAALILNNDFSKAAWYSIGYGSAADSLNSAQVFGNILGEGVTFHVQFPYTNSFGWFLDRNTYVDTNLNIIPLPFLDPISSSVHMGN